jgi:hypothetical protein
MAIAPVAAEVVSGGEVMDEMLWFAERFESIAAAAGGRVPDARFAVRSR